MKGATNRDNLLIGSVSNFNPRTREGCDLVDTHRPYLIVDISIHAPVKGATSGVGMMIKPEYFISIHAPVKGATDGVVDVRRGVNRNFNPRTREGCD